MIKYTPVSSFADIEDADEYNVYNRIMSIMNTSNSFSPEGDIDLVSDLVFEPTIIGEPSIAPKSDVSPDQSIKIDSEGESKLEYTPSPGEDSFKESYLKAIGEEDNMYKFFSLLAKNESGYNPKAKNPNAPAYGYFQFMQDGVRYHNISHYGDVDIDTFLNTPEIQINAARSLADSFLSHLNEEDLAKMTEKGITRSGALGGMWLGGYGGFKKYLYNDENISDKHWSPSGAGIDMKTQIKRYNGLFKKGGRIEKASLGTIFSTDKPRGQRRSGVGVLKNDYYGEDMYDYNSSPIIPDDGHWPSRGDGILLKNSNHPTSFHEYEQSKERGLSLYEDRNGREYTLEEWQVNMPEYLLKGLKKKPYPSYSDDRSHYSYIDKNYNRIKYMWDELLSAGASPEQAAAILGNFYQESKLDYSTVRKGNGARGLAQLLGGRKAAYEEYLSLNPYLVDSTETQIKYLIPIIFGDESNPHGLKNLYRYDIKKGETKYLPYDSYGIEWNKSQRSAFRNAKTLDDMVVAFENNFERAKGDSMDIRKLAARYIYKIMNK